MDLLLKNGYVVDAANDFEGMADILVDKGKIVRCAPDITENADRIIDCSGKTVIPGICDMHVHFRDPGQTHKEDILTGCEAAAAGGVTAVACMPNTTPPVDNAKVVMYIQNKARGAKAKVYPIGCITKGMKGEELCDYEELCKAGCVAVSDDGKPVRNAQLMSRAMVKAHYAGLRVISHCEDPDIIAGGIMNSGNVSKELGIPGMHRMSEDTQTAREIVMAGDLEMPIHIAHVSTSTSMLLVRLGAKYGAMVTSETCPHYFTLTDEKLRLRDADYRMNPPLRTEDDVTAITEAVCDGTIDCIVTDHAPHTAEEKADFEKAPNGVVGLETSLAATLTELYHRGKITLKRIVRLMCVNPRRILNIPGGSFSVGEPADIAVFDPSEEWVVDPDKLHSKSHNTCFKGMKLKGRVKMTILDGNVVYEDKQMKIDVKLENGLLPDKYGKYGEIKIGDAPSISFPIKIEGVPNGAKTLALTFVDFDSIPVCGFAWKHWLAANVPADIDEMPENASQDGAFGMVQGKTDFSGEASFRYGGPMPPDKTHNYTLTVFALDCYLELAEGFSLDALNTAMDGHILGKAEIVLPSRS